MSKIERVRRDLYNSIGSSRTKNKKKEKSTEMFPIYLCLLSQIFVVFFVVYLNDLILLFYFI